MNSWCFYRIFVWIVLDLLPSITGVRVAVVLPRGKCFGPNDSIREEQMVTASPFESSQSLINLKTILIRHNFFALREEADPSLKFCSSASLNK